MAAIVVILILIILGGIGYYGFSSGWFDGWFPFNSSDEDDDDGDSLESLESDIKNYFGSNNAGLFNHGNDRTGSDLTITLNGVDVKSLVTTNGFIRPNSTKGMQDYIIIASNGKRQSDRPTSNEEGYRPSLSGRKPSSSLDGLDRSKLTPASRPLVSDQISIKPVNPGINRIKLWKYNADRMMRLSNSVLAADDKEVITMLNPYLASTRKERISLAKKMCSIPYENGIVETGSADPVTGEYVCGRYANFFHEAKSRTYARVRDIVHPDYHDAITPGEADTLIPPHNPSKDMNWTNTREWARQFCQGGKKVGGHRYECRVCLETYYGECGYGNRKIKGNHC